MLKGAASLTCYVQTSTFPDYKYLFTRSVLSSNKSFGFNWNEVMIGFFSTELASQLNRKHIFVTLSKIAYIVSVCRSLHFRYGILFLYTSLPWFSFYFLFCIITIWRLPLKWSEFIGFLGYLLNRICSFLLLNGPLGTYCIRCRLFPMVFIGFIFSFCQFRVYLQICQKKP